MPKLVSRCYLLFQTSYTVIEFLLAAYDGLTSLLPLLRLCLWQGLAYKGSSLTLITSNGFVSHSTDVFLISDQSSILGGAPDPAMQFDIPLDSPLAKVLPKLGGPANLVNSSSIARYVNLAALVVLFYDHLTTFRTEVERIWTLPWRLPKFLFVFHRYLIPPLFVFGWVVFNLHDTTVPFCDFVWAWKLWPSRLTILTVQIITIIRLLALYDDQRKLITRFILFAYTLEIGAIITLNVINIQRTHAMDTYNLVPGCLFSLSPTLVSNTWIPPIIFEGLVIILTLYKLVPLWRQGSNDTLRILARDSIVYFIFIMTMHIVNLAVWRSHGFLFGDAYATPSSVFASLIASRMMMNLRGLSPALDKNINDRCTLDIQLENEAIGELDVWQLQTILHDSTEGTSLNLGFIHETG